MLRRKVAQQEIQIKALQSLNQNIGENAIKAPFGRFLLVKDGTQCLALQITEHVDADKAEKSKSKYRWLLQADGSMDFSKPNVQQGQGELSEYKNGVWQGIGFIRQGAFNLEWSLSDWIYFQNRQSKIQFAMTEWVRPEDIDLKSNQADWRSAPSKGWP